MSYRITFLLAVCCLALPPFAHGQSMYGGKYQIKSKTYNRNDYTLYIFSRKKGEMKAKYFAQNAYSQYENWKAGKEILLVTAGAFSSGWNRGAAPVGLCVDNGVTVNRSMEYDMDGMVIIYNGGAQQGGVAVVDMDERPVRVEEEYGNGRFFEYHPRSSHADRINFLDWGANQGVTLFQTQLLYSSDKSRNFNNLYYGQKRERRFLALCRKSAMIYHIVIDAPNPLELNLAGKNAKELLEEMGFEVLYILNLDTGGKNVLQVSRGRGLMDLEPNPDAHIRDATNLIIYYRD